MSYYTVLKPCVVGNLHYAHIPAQPIEADDAVADTLVTSGSLAYYPPRPAEPKTPVTVDADAPAEVAPPRRRAAKG